MKGAKPDLPVDPERLRREFPAMTAEDLAAYVEVTRRILAEHDAERRAQLIRETVSRARRLRERPAGERDLTAEESLALQYLAAVEKMQARTR
jgi:hypothetical protein